MKPKDCKVGMLVLATKKSLGFKDLKSFLRIYPLGVARINAIGGRNRVVICEHWFSPEDLVSLEETND